MGTTVACAETEQLITAGRQLYRTAAKPDGSTLRALVQADVALPGIAAACANCHRRSGIGASEGGSRALNLTAPVLFSATNKVPFRPAYDDATLARAIIAGIAADGRDLDVTMPRYELGADDAAALIAYLRSLGAEVPAGVTASDLHIAAVVAADAPEHERAAVEAVMRRYVDLKNGESRRESKRAAAADRHAYGRSMQRAYRTWQLHLWILDGPASAWREQLDSLYAETTPFALVSGTAGADWPVVDQFCESREIPCILPLSDFAPVGKPGFYSLHFSRGVALEAEVTARHIVDSELPNNTRILVAYDKDLSGQTAVDALRSRLARDGFTNLIEFPVAPGKSPTVAEWQSLLRSKQPDVLISWVAANTLSALVAGSSNRTDLPNRIYTAQSFTDWAENAAVHDQLRDRINHVYPYSLPRPALTQFPREETWLKLQGLSELDAVSAGKVLLACRALGMGLADIQSNFSREYLLEALEHALDAPQLTSIFPRISLGPDQRFLAGGAYVVNLTGKANQPFAKPVWVQP